MESKQEANEGSASGSTSELPASILVVDDEADVLETMTDLLALLGFEVFSAGSGEEALRVLRETPGIEVLLTDVLMPQMSGVSLALQAKRLAPDLKVIFASGYAPPDLHAAIAESNEFHYLAKPFKVPELARALRL